MKIKSVRIQHLRAFKDQTVPLNDYTCLVGPNGSGKSTVFTALNIFFRNSSGPSVDVTTLQEEDFHAKDTSAPITITVTFCDLSPEAQSDFKDYYRQEELVVQAKATFDSKKGIAEVKQYGLRKGMDDFAPYFRAEGDGEKLPELKNIYADIRKRFPGLPDASTKPTMTKALRDYEASRPDECTLIESEDQFYGISRGANRLARHIQWVFVPAIKDATDEQIEGRNTALGSLLARTVRSRTNLPKLIGELRDRIRGDYQKVLDDNQKELDALSEALAARLSEWAHPDAKLRLQWEQDPDKSVRVDDPLAGVIAGEGDFEGKLSRFGHGLQRSYLLALLQELSHSDDAQAPRLILACEEPELYQHPPQARHLAAVLSNLSTRNSQVIVCTHNPLFVSGRSFEDVRMIRKEPATGQAHCSFASHSAILERVAKVMPPEKAPKGPSGVRAKIHQELQPQLNEMFFTNVLVFVEGLEDVAYITTYLTLMERWQDFRKMGCHLVPTGGKSQMILPLATAQILKIPTFVVCDADSPGPLNPGHRALHERDNLALQRLMGVEKPQAFPEADVKLPDLIMWAECIGAVVKAEFGDENFNGFKNALAPEYDFEGKLGKNSLFIADLLEKAWEDGVRSSTLEAACNSILSFAGSTTGLRGPKTAKSKRESPKSTVQARGSASH